MKPLALAIALFLFSCDHTPKHIVTQPAVIDSVWVEQEQTGTPPFFTKTVWHFRANEHWAISHTQLKKGDTIIFYNYGEKH